MEVILRQDLDKVGLRGEEVGRLMRTVGGPDDHVGTRAPAGAVGIQEGAEVVEYVDLRAHADRLVRGVREKPCEESGATRAGIAVGEQNRTRHAGLDGEREKHDTDNRDEGIQLMRRDLR